MNLNILWFILIGTLFFVYFFLDGVDFGIGMLVPFLGKDDKVNKKMIHAIGPTWGASEVWLLTAGGAMFAAFPGWYATMFSGFYPALFILLAALIIRGVSIEFREKALTPAGKKRYDIGIFIGNFLTPLLLAVALACLVRGVPINEEMEYTGTLFSLFSPFTLLAGVTAVAFFLYHGAVMLELKQPNEIKGVREAASKAGLVTILLFMLTIVSSVFETNVFGKPVSTVFAVITFLALLASYFMNKKDSRLMALIMNAITIVGTVITLFAAMFPNVMVSSTDAAYNLDIYNIASGSYTLTVITVVTVTLLPIVIGYTAWTYYVFSIKSAEDKDIEY